jgi:lipoic acid synthetase
MPRLSLQERAAQRPGWMKIRLRDQASVDDVTSMMRELRLTTVCEEAKCPNLFECWADRTATFMLMGEVCTRHCGFCAVAKGAMSRLDPSEPEHVADAVERLGLEHAVVTSVNRDDLEDGGARHFAHTIDAIRRRQPGCTVEVLIPDFAGNSEALDIVLAAAPDIVNHNVETVPRLYRRVRNGSDFERSLAVLARAARAKGTLIRRTKSGIMLGLGESEPELLEAMHRLRESEVDVLTLGQYLQPTASHLPIERWVTPEEFAQWGERARSIGFAHVESGPFVRSSYHAKRHLPAPS